jgi:hypothetical protein
LVYLLGLHVLLGVVLGTNLRLLPVAGGSLLVAIEGCGVGAALQYSLCDRVFVSLALLTCFQAGYLAGLVVPSITTQGDSAKNVSPP